MYYILPEGLKIESNEPVYCILYSVYYTLYVCMYTLYVCMYTLYVCMYTLYVCIIYSQYVLLPLRHMF